MADSLYGYPKYGSLASCPKCDVILGRFGASPQYLKNSNLILRTCRTCGYSWKELCNDGTAPIGDAVINPWKPIDWKYQIPERYRWVREDEVRDLLIHIRQELGKSFDGLTKENMPGDLCSMRWTSFDTLWRTMDESIAKYDPSRRIKVDFK